MKGNFFAAHRESIDASGQNVLSGEMRIAEQVSDDVLLRRAAKGDEEAFTLLYRRHQAALYRFALRMTGNTWAAEEIVQDVFMILMRDPKKYDATRGTLGGFLCGVARNRVLKHLERLPREVPLKEKGEDGVGSGIVLQDPSTPATEAEKRERREHQLHGRSLAPVAGRGAVVRCYRRRADHGRRGNRANHRATADHAPRPPQVPRRVTSPDNRPPARSEDQEDQTATAAPARPGTRT